MQTRSVLILVVVEDVLVLQEQSTVTVFWQCVLILVVVEDVLVLRLQQLMMLRSMSLNPCCGGRCSSTEETITELEGLVPS